MDACEVSVRVKLDALLWSLLVERCERDGISPDTSVGEAIRLWLIVQKKPWLHRGETRREATGREEAEEIADMCLPSYRFRAIFGEALLEEARIVFAPYATVADGSD